MTTAIGVLCARVRVEEKQIITALGDAGAVAMSVPPASMPLPPCPAPQDLAALGTLPEQNNSASTLPSVMIDRIPNRAVASSLLRMLKCAHVQVIDAGLAATGSRLDVVTALAGAGLPRPASLVAFSEASAVEAAASLGFPSTLLPMTAGSAPTTLLDSDTADAVIEHRIVLGHQHEAIVLLQAGAPAAHERVRLHIVGGTAVAFEGAVPTHETVDLAQRAAKAIDASFVAIDIACVAGTWVVWDAAPVADFRQGTLLGSTSVGQAVAALAMERARSMAGKTGTTSWEGEHHVIALTA